MDIGEYRGIFIQPIWLQSADYAFIRFYRHIGHFWLLPIIGQYLSAHYQHRLNS